jgi:hypothetical protein
MLWLKAEALKRMEWREAAALKSSQTMLLKAEELLISWSDHKRLYLQLFLAL